MTLEESKEEFLKELNKTNQLILGAYKNAVDRLNKETQELQEQNAELVEMLEYIFYKTNFKNHFPTTSINVKNLLTKYKHLNKKK